MRLDDRRDIFRRRYLPFDGTMETERAGYVPHNKGESLGVKFADRQHIMVCA
jgi:hypothetical protein